MLVLLVRVESSLVYVARAEAGLPVVEDTVAVAAPRQAGLARLRRALGFAPFFRAFVAIEFSFLALLAAIWDEVAGDLEGTQLLVEMLVPVAAIIAVGRLAAILASAAPAMTLVRLRGAHAGQAARRSCAAAIESLLAQEGVEVDVVVVGNGWQPEGLPEVRGVFLPEDVGIPGGRNAGVPAVRGELLFFLDDDARLAGHRRAGAGGRSG